MYWLFTRSYDLTDQHKNLHTFLSHNRACYRITWENKMSQRMNVICETTINHMTVFLLIYFSNEDNDIRQVPSF